MQQICEELETEVRDSSPNSQDESSTMGKIRILLVDEDSLFRLRIRHMLELERGIESVGDCASAEEMLSQVKMLSPNIVVMDVQLSGMGGIEACHQLSKRGYGCEVILLATDQKLITAALMAGACGFYPKDIRYSELVTAIRLAYKWQCSRPKSGSSNYSMQQTEAMIMDNLDHFSTTQIRGEDAAKWLRPEDAISNCIQPEVTLVIAPPDDATRLRAFIPKVEQTLQASIRETVGTWHDISITFRLHEAAPITSIIEKIMGMPDVDRAEEETLMKHQTSSVSKENGATPKKRLSVILGKQAEPLTIEKQANPYIEIPIFHPVAAGLTVR